ncbi:capsular polysaccharide synthesis protein [Lactiplantibacillus plantarum]|uniref:capsular polysaccharide synthesis protein n=1 Tax=Lactiplantibacillus plantarum TaxID=1590 RepID=UPI0039C25B90
MKNKKLIKSLLAYIKAGQFLWIIGLAPLFLNSNKKNLEILREKINFEIHRKLEKKYMNIDIEKNFNSEPKKEVGKHPVWLMWLQGINNAPALCQENFKYLKKAFGKRVWVITADNVLDFVDLPAKIIEKWRHGNISNTHFSDIVRIQLLCTYGGVWIDSTVFVKKELVDSNPTFMIPQTYKPGRDGNVLPVSSWFIKSEANNAYLSRVRDLLFTYWDDYNFLLDYFLLHHFLIIASDEMENYLDRLYPLDNTMPHYLMLKMRNTKLSASIIDQHLEHFDLIKFTNKYNNQLERENYRLLLDEIKKMNLRH